MTISTAGLEILSIWKSPILRPYLGEINRRHGVVDTLALPNLRDLPPLRIEKLFVQPELSLRWVSPLIDPAKWPKGETLIDALEQSPSLVLLGDPGSGKTTLINWLAWRLSTGFDKKLPLILENRLPIPCVLREMRPEVFNSNTGVDDLAVIISKKLLGEKSTDKLEEKLREYVATNRYILLLDGLDEISVDHRVAVAAWVQQATKDEACVVVTTRVVGYEDFPIHAAVDTLEKTVSDDASHPAPLNFFLNESQIREKLDLNFDFKTSSLKPEVHGWAQLRYLMPFDQKRIASFVGNWYLQRSLSEQDAKERTKDLLAAFKQSAVTLELARTPNLLSLIAIVHRERAHLPDGRALLYKEIANAYINTIDQHRKISAGDALASYDWGVRESWLAFVGFNMQLARSTSEGEASGVLIDESQVLYWLEEAMAFSGVVESTKNAKLFLDWVARRSGLLLPRGEGRYAFVHLSFQEYFCARYLVSRVRSPKFLQNKLDHDATVTKSTFKDWRESPYWRECLIFALELISAEGDSDWGTYFAELLFGGANEDDISDWAVGALAARALSDRHVLLDDQWKNSLAVRCSQVNIPEVISTLVNLGYAYVIADAEAKLEWPFSDVDLAKNINIFEIQNKDKVYILILYKIEAISESSFGFENLRKLVLHNSDMKDANFVRGLKNLKELSFNSSSLVDISAVSKLVQLQILNFNGVCIDDTSQLSKLKNLTQLQIINSPLENIVELVNFKNIYILSLSNTKVKNISSLSRFKKIIFLDLKNTLVEDLSPLSKLNSLLYLELSGTSTTDIEPLKNLKNLTTMWLSFTHTKDVSPLLNLTNLTSLYLNNTEVEDISGFGALQKLHSLVLSNTQVNDITPLKEIKSLSSLHLAGTKIKTLSPISGLTDLRNLNISGTGIDDLSEISELNNLRELDISNTQIKDIRPLSKLKNLRALHLDGSLVEDLSALVESKKLILLSIENTKIKDVSVLSGLSNLQIIGFNS